MDPDRRAYHRALAVENMKSCRRFPEKRRERLYLSDRTLTVREVA
jgi:hypothetical protein